MPLKPPSARVAGLIALVLACASAAHAASYYVEPVQGEAMEPSLLSTVQQLISDTVSETGNQVASDPAGADFLLKAQLLKLGESMILTLSKDKPGPDNDQVLFMRKLKAASVDELDVVSSRLTRAVIKEQDPDGNARIGEVTEREQRRLVGPRVESRSSNYLGFGPFVQEHMGLASNDDIAYSLSFGHQWDTTSQAAITLGYEASFKDWSFINGVQLGVCYYFDDEDTAPFVGLDMGYGAARSDNTSTVFGFSGGARAGFMFFRNSSTQLSLQLRYLGILEDNGKGYPSSTGLVVSLYE